MGLIKNVVGAISGIVGTLFSVILGIFGLGKKSEYFLEFDETAAATSEPAPAPVAPTPASPEPAPKPAMAEKVAPVAAATAPPSAPKAEVPRDGGLTFATDFLTTLGSTSRRRPGPSLSPFAAMAKEMKRSGSMG